MTVKVSGSSGLIFLDGILQSYGDSNDLQINHDGSNSYINDAGTGNLRLQTGGSTKLEVTSSGIDVTGTITTDGLTVAQSSPTITITDTDGSTNTTLKTVGSNTELSNPSGGNLRFRTNASELERMRISPDGDISFYEDTGTTAKFFWDASAETLSVGGTTGTKSVNTTNGIRLYESTSARFDLDATSTGTTFRTIGAYPQIFKTSDTERMRIDSSGNLGINTTSPSGKVGIQMSGDGVGLSVNSSYGAGGYQKIFSVEQSSSDGFLYMRSASGTVNAKISGYGATHSYFASAGGNVGIGTTSPSAKLDVVGDIEVSGGVYVGGTGSANYLDDYEEGTWTPSLGRQTAFGGITYSNQGGKYTKVGNLVTVWFDLSVSYYTGGSGYLYIAGLPFGVITGQSNGGYGSPQFRDPSLLETDFKLYNQSSWFVGTTIRIMHHNSSGTETYTTLGSSSGRITGQGFYYTNS